MKPIIIFPPTSPPNILVAVIITLGAHTLNVNEEEQVKQRVPAANVLRHTSSDAALIRTEQSITYTWAIQAIRLPQLSERNEGFAGYAGIASGWGKSGEKKITENALLRCKFIFF
jgi:hypothetical protein